MFHNGDKVLIHSTGSEQLDGETGKIIGLSVDNIFKIYIVKFDNQIHNYNYEAGTVPDCCLTRQA